MEMAQCIIENARGELLATYPNPLYEGETSDSANKSAYPKTFGEPLTLELFQKHQELSESAKLISTDHTRGRAYASPGF